jgi:branched-subunit amino acid transport protein
MVNWSLIGTILALGVVSYGMRIGGFLAAGALPNHGLPARLLRLIPGNLFAALVSVGILTGGWPTLFGCLGALSAMVVTRREWAALGVGFGTMTLASGMLGHDNFLVG